MMKKYKIFIFLLLAFSLEASNSLQDKIKQQNQNVVKLAAKSLSKDLPKKVDKYTNLVSIKSKNETLIYTFEINAPVSDEEIKNKDKTRMQKAVTHGVCKSSKRFLENDINISYIYTSAKSKKKLFQFDIDKKKCKFPDI